MVLFAGILFAQALAALLISNVIVQNEKLDRAAWQKLYFYKGSDDRDAEIFHEDSSKTTRELCFATFWLSVTLIISALYWDVNMPDYIYPILLGTTTVALCSGFVIFSFCGQMKMGFLPALILVIGSATAVLICVSGWVAIVSLVVGSLIATVISMTLGEARIQEFEKRILEEQENSKSIVV